MKDIGNQTFNSAMYVSIFGVLSIVLAYVFRIILARSLTLEEYGLFYAVFSFVSFFLFFRGFGTQTALVKFISQYRIKKEYNKVKTAIFSVFTIQMISSLVMGVILFLLAPFLAENYFRNESAILIMRLFVVYIFLSVIFKILRNIFSGFQKFKLFSLMEPIRMLTTIIFLIIFLIYGKGVFSPILSLIIGWSFVILLFLPFLTKMFDFSKYKISKVKIMTGKILWFGLPLMFVGVSSKVISNIDTLILTYFSTLEQVGIYNVILPSSLIFLFIGNSLSTIFLPLSSSLWTKGMKEKLAYNLAKSYKYTLLFTVPIILATLIYANLFLDLFFGEAFVEGTAAFRVLLVGVLFYTLAVINNSVLSGIGKPRLVMKILLSASLINLVLNMILIPLFGIMGAAFSTSISYIFVLSLNYGILKKTMNLDLKFKFLSNLIIGSLLFMLIMYLVKTLFVLSIWSKVILSFLLSASAYLAYLIIVGAVSIKEIKFLFVRK